METLLLKATVTPAAEKGEFEAVISTVTVDREGDVVDPDGMVRALLKWTKTGKLIPLAWDHSAAAEDQIGHIIPSSARNVDGEVRAKGWIDQEIDVGKHAWRLVKSGTLGFSFGYMILAASERKGGGLDIKELDVFEITATPIPANADTRVLGWKALGVADKLRAMADDVSSDSPPESEDVARQMSDLAAEVADKGIEDASTLRRRADRVALKAAVDDLPPKPPAEQPKPEDEAPPDEPEQAGDDASEPATEPADKNLESHPAHEAGSDREEEAEASRSQDKSPRSVDPLRRQADGVELKFATAGTPLKPPPKIEQPKPELLPLKELKQRMRDEMLKQLSGGMQ